MHRPNDTADARHPGLRSGCLGCAACTGICAALVELLTLPGIIVKGSRA